MTWYRGFDFRKRTWTTLFLLVLCSLTACSSSDESSSDELESTNVEDLSFFERESQHVEERDVRAQLSPSDSLLISSDLEIYGISHLVLEDGELYIVDGSRLRIVVLDAESLQEERTIQISEGEGPGELPLIGNFDVQGNQMILGSSSLHRIQFRDLAGELISEASIEAYAKSLGLAPDGNMIGLMSPVMSNSDDVIHIVSPEGELMSSFANIQDGKNMLTDVKLHGYVSLGGNDQLFYAGYAEHLLKSWDIEGNLIFSVETIEPGPDDINYMIREGSEMRAVGYAENAEFSANELISTDDALIVLHDDMSSQSVPNQVLYLDFYDTETGMYSHSLVLPKRTRRIAIQGNTLYASHVVEDDNYLFRYAMD